MLKIVKDNIPSLREKCKDVPLPLSAEDRMTIDNMLRYLLNSQDPAFRDKHPQVREGVGLAAPQIGVNKKMLVISYPTGDEANPVVQYQLVNPRIIANSIRKCFLSGGEGCLSVDEDHPGRVYRDFKITVKAYDATNDKDVTIVARGYDAVVLQHEIDHLSGVLYYDHIDPKNPFKDIPGSVEL